MTTADLTPALLAQAACETLEQLAFAEALPCPPPAPVPPDLLSGRLSFSGPLQGAFVIRIPPALVQQLAGNALGDSDCAADPQMLRDAVGEFLNTIAGSVLRGAGVSEYELGLPEYGAAGAIGAGATWLEINQQKLALEVEGESPG